MSSEILGPGGKRVEMFLLCRVCGQCHCPNEGSLSLSAPAESSSPGHYNLSILVVMQIETFFTAWSKTDLCSPFSAESGSHLQALETLQFLPLLRCELPAGSVAELRNSIPSSSLTLTVACSPMIKREQSHK